MMPEIGHFALTLALCLALILALVPAWGAWRGNSVAMALAPSLAIDINTCYGLLTDHRHILLSAMASTGCRYSMIRIFSATSSATS